MKNLKIALIAAICMTTLAVSSYAGTVSASDGDILLGFRATGGTGSTLNLEVDLGSYTNFNGLVAGTTFALPQLSPLDLSGAYGSTWFQRSDLLWSVATSSANTVAGLPDNTFFETSVDSSLSNSGGGSTVFKRQTSTAQFSVAQNIDGFVSGLNGSTTTANSSSASLVPDGGNSYDANINAGTRPWNANSTSLMSFTNVENNTNIPSGGFVQSDFYELLPTASGTANALELGYFRLFDNGTLTFTEVPEPSTYAVAALAAIFVLITAIRRRGKAKLA